MTEPVAPDPVWTVAPGTLPADVPQGYVALSLEIMNTYELHEDVTTWVVAVVPKPDPDDTGWDWDHIQPLTGAGHTDGDAWYDVTVLDSSDPDLILIGTEYEFGY